MSAWASVKAPKAANLGEIMDDQAFLTSDLSVAELISFEEIQTGTAAPVPAVNSEDFALADDDADLAFALALQEQLYEEEQTRKAGSSATGNVRLAFADGRDEAEDAVVVEDYEDYSCGGRSDAVVDKALRLHAQKKRVKGVEVAGRISAKDFKSTQQGVLDPATTNLIFKMLQNGTLSRCDTNVTVKTGKEASVFYGEPDFESEKNSTVNPDHFDSGCAVKIFKTTLNEFSNRSDYYDGDHRFGKFNKIGTTRESIAKWAEKEYRNLMRVNKRSKIFAPEALTFKEHIVIMSFVGRDGIPAPQLKEVPRTSLSAEDWTAVYLDTVTIIYSLYHDCKLVHGDLSEYNLLRYDDETWVIDFGQAVDTSHPDHVSLMLRDIRTVNNFFVKCFVPVLDAEAILSIVLQPLKELDCVFSQSRSAPSAPVDAASADLVCDSELRDKMVKRILLQYLD